MAPQVAEARAAFREAAGEVRDLDSSGYAGSVRSRFDDYVDLVTEADRVLGSAADGDRGAARACSARDGPRDYLLVFQNNAEIRATGGLPGSWALVHAEDGKLTMRQQGTGGQFGVRESPGAADVRGRARRLRHRAGHLLPVLELHPGLPACRRAVGAPGGRRRSPGPTSTGCSSLDPVAMSYLLAGTGPVQVADRTLTADNAVDELLSRPYLELEPTGAGRALRRAARAIFDATTGDLADPVEFVKGVARAAEEGRLLVAPFDDSEREALAGHPGPGCAVR